MKCPNCGKEAINVNGKFVCLDCGVELTSHDSNIQETPTSNTISPQNQPDPVAAALEVQEEAGAKDSLLDENKLEAPQPAQSALNREETQSFANESKSVFPTFEDSAQKKTKGPVEEAFVNDLKEVTEPTSGAGSYDFTNTEDNKTDEAVKTTEVTDASTDSSVAAGLAVPDSISQSEPVGLSSSQETQEAPTFEVPKTENFFKPNSFDIKNQSHDAPEVSSNFDDLSTPSQPEMNEPNVSDLVDSNQSQSEIENNSPGLEPELPPENLNIPQEVSDPVDPVGGNNLDSLLNQYSSPKQAGIGTLIDQSVSIPEVPTATPEEPTTPEAGIPGVDNVQPTVPGMAATQIAAQPGADTGEMLSVESVFGNSENNEDITQSTSDNVPTPGRRTSGKLWIIIAAVVGGILLFGGVGFGIYYFLNSNSNLNSEQTLSEIDANSLSEKVSIAMSEAPNVSVNFDEAIDFSQLISSDEILDESQKDTYSNSGFWELDSESNAYISNSVNGNLNKRTYIDEDTITYIHNQTTDEYDEMKGFQIINFPVLYDIQEKGAVLYSTNAELLVELLGEDEKGPDYKKIKVNPTESYVKEIIGSSREMLGGIEYEELNTDNLNIVVYIDPENKIEEISMEGSIGIKSSLFNGTISVSSRATYIYNEVVITRPEQEESVTMAEEENEEVAVVPPKAPAVEPEEETIEVVDARG